MSDLGNLSNCVMDGDPGATGWARRLRRRAFLASLVLEAALAGAMLLWPLITPAVLPTQLAMTPVPPYRPETPRPEAMPSGENARPAMYIDTLPNPLHPTVHRVNPTELGGEPPNPGDFPIGDGSAAGPSIPGGSRDGRPIEVPRPAPPNRPVNMSAGVMAALLVHRVQPEYPKLAQVMHLSGTVELQARIATDGTVQQLDVVSGNPILAQAAVEAVQQWRYQPTRLDGQTVEVETHITVTFTMQ
jgi:periplasmic protein TonB